MTLAVIQTNSRSLWYLSRGTGVVVLLLLTASAVLGILLSVRWRTPQWPRFVTNGLHRNVSLLVVAFLGLHIVTAVADPFAGIGWIDAVVPLSARYRPVWLGLGALSFDLLVVIVATSLVRRQIGLRLWRAIHWFAYLAWPLALVHGMGTGTDVKTPWMLAVDIVCLLLVVGAVWWRLVVVAPPASGSAGHVPVWAAVASVVVPALICGWLALGPLRPGWARRAGTPTQLLATARGQAVTATATATGWPAAGFTAPMSGQLSQTPTDAQANTTVTISTHFNGSAAGSLVVVLHGQALAGQGVRLSSSDVSGGPTAQPTFYRGQVTVLNGTQLDMSLHDAAGHTMAVSEVVHIDPNGTDVTGTVRVQPGSVS